MIKYSLLIDCLSFPNMLDLPTPGRKAPTTTTPAHEPPAGSRSLQPRPCHLQTLHSLYPPSDSLGSCQTKYLQTCDFNRRQTLASSARWLLRSQTEAVGCEVGMGVGGGGGVRRSASLDPADRRVDARFFYLTSE